MRRFLIKSTLVFTIMLIVMLLLDVLITNNLHHSKANLIRGINDAYFDSTNYDIVVLGSSRGLRHFDTRVLDSMLDVNSYNQGITGRGIVSQITKYVIFEKHHGVPKVIIQNIDYCTLKIDDGLYKEQYLPYLYDKSLFNATRKYEKFRYVDRYIPLIRYAGYEQMIKEGLGLKSKMHSDTWYKGFMPMFAKWNGKVFETVDRIDFSSCDESISIFREHLEKCKENGVQIIFVYSPLYIGAQLKMDENNKKEMYNTFANIAREFDIPIVSWLDSPICEDTFYFYNATHLNAIGAKKFTQELSLCIDSLSLLTDCQ